MKMVVLVPLAPAQIPPVALPVETCMYCWYVLHPSQSYPEAWSSTCCTAHRAWVEKQLATRRLHRLADQGS